MNLLQNPKKYVCISWYQYLDDQKFVNTRANKVKLVIESVENFGQIQYRIRKNTFGKNTRIAIINDARHGHFDFVHAKIMKNISSMYSVFFTDPLNLTGSPSRVGILKVATKHGHYYVVKYLVDNLENKNPNVDRRHGTSALHLAAIHGRIFIVKYIMSKVLDINPVDNYEQTPLHFAAAGGKVDVVKYIMDKIRIKIPKDNKGKTPLHKAAMNGNLTVFKYIIKNVEEKNPRDNNGNTPLDLARQKDFLDYFKRNLKIYGYRVIGRHTTLEGIY